MDNLVRQYLCQIKQNESTLKGRIVLGIFSDLVISFNLTKSVQLIQEEQLFMIASVFGYGSVFLSKAFNNHENKQKTKYTHMLSIYTQIYCCCFLN